jgi:Ca-activated chloride channel family protein
MTDRTGVLRGAARTSTNIVAIGLVALPVLTAAFGCEHARSKAAEQGRPAAVSAHNAIDPSPRRAAAAAPNEPSPSLEADQPHMAHARGPATAASMRVRASSEGKVAESSKRESARADDLLDGAFRSAPSQQAAGIIGTIGHGGLGTGYGAGGGRLTKNRMAAIAAAPPADFNTEAYAHNPDNPYRLAADSPLSTFSVDVDTASYSNVRRFLRDGQRPPIDAVRIEEMINYFRYAYAAPTADAPFGVSTEVATAPWNARHRLVQIGLRARDVESAAVPARNLVFLIDVSGSMQSPDKLPLLKSGLAMLARQLRPQDRIAMVVYAGASGLALPSTAGSEQNRILRALAELEAGGSTNGAAGIELAYQVAKEHFIRGGINRVILATDGDFNVGVTDQGSLVRLIEEKRTSGVFLTVLGFGTSNLKDSTMETLADKGNGHYAYVDSLAEAKKVLVRESGSTLYTVAKDVKLQIEWNPKRVASYRLIGYENRVLADRDFNDDKKDAGDMGAGHTVTALYEVELAGDAAAASEVDPLKYQAERRPTPAAESTELMTVKLRYKRPDASESTLLSRTVVDGGHGIDQSSSDFRWAAAVAGFGMLLRQSEQRGDVSLALVQKLARSAVGDDRSGDRKELIELLQRAAALGIGG